jgi:hypothetical protein
MPIRAVVLADLENGVKKRRFENVAGPIGLSPIAVDVVDRLMCLAERIHGHERRKSSHQPALENRAFLRVRRGNERDAVHELHGHAVAFEAAIHNIMMRSLAIAPGHLEGLRVLPGAAGGDFGRSGDRPGGEHWRRAGHCGFTHLPMLDPATHRVFSARVPRAKHAGVISEIESDTLQVQAVALEPDWLA